MAKKKGDFARRWLDEKKAPDNQGLWCIFGGLDGTTVEGIMRNNDVRNALLYTSDNLKTSIKDYYKFGPNESNQAFDSVDKNKGLFAGDYLQKYTALKFTSYGLYVGAGLTAIISSNMTSEGSDNSLMYLSEALGVSGLIGPPTFAGTPS